ncbi:glycosyltransferase family 4 protein [Desertivirga xinjiangensis]|uniref:glycosyltransferase family 4 protein n=1 Tax=Desertivirga xinjiangensis TaxID=539206 RepID=UPI00210A86AF|nr:glycosyltransferase family 4 protein [Pedobacter xinjiangensis]
MKIAFILPELKGGGIGTYYRNLIGGLIANGEDVITILANSSPHAIDKTFPGEIKQINDEDLRKGLDRSKQFDVLPGIHQKLALSFACRECLNRNGGADVIELTDYNLLFFYFLAEKNKHVIIRLAGSSGQLEVYEHRKKNSLENMMLLMLEISLLNQADYIIALSRTNQRYWQKLLNRDVNHHLPYLRYSFPVTSTIPQISRHGLVLGRLQLWKGAKFIADFYEKYRDAPAIDWMGGDNYYIDYNQSMAIHLSKTYPSIWNTKLHFKGKQEYSVAQKAIDDASFILVPSVWDTFNFVITEAMWQGKIVIASDGAGASEIIEHGKTGFVFKNEDPESLQDAFRNFISLSSEEVATMANNAATEVRKLLNNDRLLIERIELFRVIYQQPVYCNKQLSAYMIEKLQDTTSSKQAIIRQLTLKNIINLAFSKLKG